MVENQRKWCRFSYLDNANFSLSKMKPPWIEGIFDFFFHDSHPFSGEHMKLHLTTDEWKIILRFWNEFNQSQVGQRLSVTYGKIIISIPLKSLRSVDSFQKSPSWSQIRFPSSSPKTESWVSRSLSRCYHLKKILTPIRIK